ncbi:hypothetical protein GE09DRAFT_1244645 [Coniochaeta sp. 2T2.1]|nr:hypothetical protein GE09DRAFT_1244645 [Coniochaeta sp. 2T2.1]
MSKYKVASQEAQHEDPAAIRRYVTPARPPLPPVLPLSPSPPYRQANLLPLSLATFTILLLLSAYAGLSSVQPGLLINDKILHFATFFLLTLAFYWILDTNRRRALHFTLVTCTLCLGVGSEFLQAFLPNGRDFDLFDIVANVVGSLGALGLCGWYHKRMLERRRAGRGARYTAVDGGEEEGGEEDVELGETVFEGGEGGHEEGVDVADEGVVVPGKGSLTLEEEVDNWDEHAVDAWDEDDLGDVGAASTGKGKGRVAGEDGGEGVEGKKRAD